MTRNQRQLLLVHKEATRWQSLACYAELLVSHDARRIRRRYANVSTVLGRYVGGGDDSIVIGLRPSVKNVGNSLSAITVVKWLLLAILVAFMVFEYHTYSFPVLKGWFLTVLHKCGLST